MNYSKKTIASLMSLVARVSEERPDLRRKLSAAYDLVVSGGVSPCPFFEDGVVALSSDGVTDYQAGPGFCQCAAGERGVLCYHRVARRLFLVAQQEEARQEAARVANPRTAKRPSLNAGLSTLTKTWHRENAARAAALPLASVTPIRGRR